MTRVKKSRSGTQAYVLLSFRFLSPPSFFALLALTSLVAHRLIVVDTTFRLAENIPSG